MPGLRGTLHEFKEGELHSGSKHGPLVKNREQAVAIALSQARKAGEHVSAPLQGLHRAAAARS
jgi:hypothetical protein